MENRSIISEDDDNDEAVLNTNNNGNNDSKLQPNKMLDWMEIKIVINNINWNKKQEEEKDEGSCGGEKKNARNEQKRTMSRSSS